MGIERIGGHAPWEARYGYSRAVRAGRWVGTAGTTATGPDGNVLHPGDPYAQATAAFGIALEALRRAGADVAHVVRTRMYVVDAAHQPAVGRAYEALFGAVRPAATMVVVQALADPGHLVEVEVEAWLDGGADR